MMRSYVIQKQKQIVEMQGNFYTPTGIHVYFKDQLNNHRVDVERVVNKVENRIPEHLLSNVEMIIIGHFDEFTERGINAFYKDSALYISPDQDNDGDLYDDVIHEIAHSVEESYGEFIYGDARVRDEFLRKREHIYNILWKMGHKAHRDMFMNVEFDKEFDDFLHKTVGYDKLSTFMAGVFISPYAATDLREYFGVGFTEFYLDSNHNFFKKVSPELYNKIKLLQDPENLD